MELEFTSDQEELRGSIRSVLAKECPIGFAREVVEKGVGVERLWEHMARLYWPALTVPEPHGGMGFGMVELAVLAEELGRAIVPGPLLPTVAMFVPAVREAGSEEQQARFLSPVAAGELTGTLAVSETGGSWDPTAIDATAVPDGDGWRLSGAKHYVVEADRVDEVVVAARVAGIPRLFVVDGAALTPEPHRVLDGTRRLGRLRLDDVRVDGDRLLDGPQDPAVALRRATDEATACVSLELVGTCTAIFEMALAYAKVREQFGVKIGSFQAMKHKFADMFVALEAARATAYFSAVAIAEDDPRRTMAASMAKALAGDAARRIAQEGIQSLGGIGYTWEHDMHLYVKRAMSSAVLMGTAEDHRQRVAALLGVTAGAA